MLELNEIADLSGYVGKSLGFSEWTVIDQAMIDAFAALTGDTQWMHTDPARAAREMPGGRTIAHGALTLSLLARLSFSIYRLGDRKRGVNYGYDKVRFLAPVPAGSRIRLEQSLLAYQHIANGARLTLNSTVHIEGGGKPALVAEAILLAFTA